MIIVNSGRNILNALKLKQRLLGRKIAANLRVDKGEFIGHKVGTLTILKILYINNIIYLYIFR